MSEDFFIYPRVNQLWPPEGDSRVTNMDVVFFSDLDDERTGAVLGKPGETWVQKGHPEVCWPQQWLPEDLGSNVRIFEIRPVCGYQPTTVRSQSPEEAALRELNDVAERSLHFLRSKFSIGVGDGYCPLVFLGHGYGRLVLKQALVQLHHQSHISKDLQSNLCGIVFYGGTDKKLTLLKDWLRDPRLFGLSIRFEGALDFKKIKVGAVNKNMSSLQETKYYFELKDQFIDVGDSNDICTPTSKEDPSYYTLLEFLQQFLPKGLHQTIDDKKSQEVQLKLSEDTEALGDMEIASTSTRENMDKEMEERQGVVQHLVGNVDHDRDMLIKEAHKLQIFLRQKIEMAQGQGGSTIFLNLHELHSKFLEDTSTFIGARRNVEKDSIEFLFLDAQCMSKVVGVGLHQALVTVTNKKDVNVEAQSEKNWEKFLHSMVLKAQDSKDGAFELIGFKMPKMEEDNNETMSLPSKDVAEQFGVGLKDFKGDHIVTMNRKEESNMFFPVILKVAEVYKALKAGDPHGTKRASGVESSTSASRDSLGGSSQQGKEEGESGQGRSLLKSSNSQKEGKGDEKEDEQKPPGGDPSPDSGPSNEPEMGLHKYTVKVYPKAKCELHDARRIPLDIKQQIMTASISSIILTIVFSRNKEKEKFLDVTTKTQCNLGYDALNPTYFGWFQDDIVISFRGISKECERTLLTQSTATNQKGEEGITTKVTTNINSGEVRGLAIQKAWRINFKAMFGGEVGESSTRNVASNFSMADTEETINVKQIEGFNVHESNVDHNLIYKFCIPTNIKNSTKCLRFLRYRDTFTPVIVGNWKVLKDNECMAAHYIFEVKRHLFHIQQNATTSKRRHLQAYKLEMFINLKMTHLDGLRSDKIIEICERNLPEAPVLIIIGQ